MSVHCDKCGYQNDLQHSFCGMCGAKLPVVPAPVAVPATEPAHQGTAPKGATSSILGLTTEPTEKDRVSYLLEEVEAPAKHWGRYVLLAVLVVAVALVGWHWRESVRGWIAGFSENPVASQLTDTSSATPTSAEAPPATSAATAPPAEEPKTGAESQAQGTSPASEQPAPAQNQTQPAASPEQTGQTDTQAQPASSAAAPTPAPATEPAPAETSGPAPAEAEPPAASAPKPSSPAVKPTNPSGIEALEAQGERYLYGNGVPVNCGLARKNLLAAAQRSSAKAQSVLGTMYATGHCVTRDLPVAYGWFAKALHRDPSNGRYEQDLKVLWRQMTEAERKLALQGQ